MEIPALLREMCILSRWEHIVGLQELARASVADALLGFSQGLLSTVGPEGALLAQSWTGSLVLSLFVPWFPL